MSNTDDDQEVKTSDNLKNDGIEDTATPAGDNNGVDKPFKVFETKEDFDKHSAGVLNSAKIKAEKELLALLGLKLDEKDKLAKFKEAYDNTLSESEKQAKNLEDLNNKVTVLEGSVNEKDAIITALAGFTGKSIEDVIKYVKMAKGLVDDNTSMQDALNEVLSLTKREKPGVPEGKPLDDPIDEIPNNNPFKSGNLTEQGKLIKEDREKARNMYKSVYGKLPSW